ncbi:MAG: glucose-6-phosphate isomerase, partial [Gammaproteobacteria bacterium]|nr:glucose-6-phosphate isomerase [Gammaproteobacteria bacterium]
MPVLTARRLQQPAPPTSVRRELCNNAAMPTENIQTPCNTAAWRALTAYSGEIGARHLRDLVRTRSLAARDLCVRVGPVLASLARQRLDERALQLLLNLCDESGLRTRINELLSGAPVNRSEDRPALHTLLRARPEAGARTDGRLREVLDERRRMLAFAAELAAGRVTGTGNAIDSIVNIGIGGSDLGPRLVVDALYEHRRGNLRVEFVSNLDGQALYRCLSGLNPARTFFLVASKSFGTVETLTNAESARRWLEQHGQPEPLAQFAAITAKPDAAQAFGVPAERVFRLWDWVGGRYSVWSSVGLPIAAQLGEQAFLEFLEGARRMDEHFAGAAPPENLPVLLGLVDLWNSAFLGAPTRAVVPYDQRLQLLPAYLGQLVMESNGKSVDNAGKPLQFPSAPIIWGGVGTDAQHAFFQLLHQGTHSVPVDLLLAARPRHGARHHQRLLAACLAQGQALMEGRVDPERHYRGVRGNQPSTTIIYDDLTPEVLGMLLALYEHRTYVHAVLLDIDPFDQWGVELGKELARDIVRDLEQGAPI